MKQVLWYEARVPARAGERRWPAHSAYFSTLAQLRDTLTPMMRRDDVRTLPVEVWQSIGPHNSVLVRAGTLYADRRVSWYRAR